MRFDAKVKFEENDEVKIRPVLIWNSQFFIIGYKMTGTDRGDSEDEYRVRYWKEAGLKKPTNIRLRHILKLEETDMIEKIGELDMRERLRFEMRIVP